MFSSVSPPTGSSTRWCFSLVDVDFTQHIQTHMDTLTASRAFLVQCSSEAYDQIDPYEDTKIHRVSPSREGSERSLLLSCPLPENLRSGASGSANAALLS